MIDQELAKNILNNLLNVTVNENGSQEERDAILASDYVTNRSEAAPLKTIVQNLEIDLQNSQFDGGCHNPHSSSVASPTEIEVPGLFIISSSSEVPTAVTRERSKIQAKYSTLTANSLKYNVIGIDCFLPVTAVNPNFAPGSDEEIYPLGFSTENLSDYITALDGVDFIAIENNNADGPLSSQGFQGLSKFSEDRRSNIVSVLSGSPLYGSSGSKNFYTYETIGGASKAKEITKTQTFEYRQWEINEETHYFKLKYEARVFGSSSTQTKYEEFECTYYFFRLSDPKQLTVTFKGWYYPQTFSTLSYYPSKAYLGLFTDYKVDEDGKNENGMPSSDGTNFREPPYKNGAEYTYQRMSLHRGLFSDGYVFNEIDKNSPEALEYAGYAHINNKEIIMFPEILNEEGWGNIYGFGVFENEVPVEGEKPYFWGYVDGAPAQPVLTSKNHVPLFRPNQFEIFLG